MAKVVKYISHLYEGVFSIQALRFLFSSGFATASHWLIMMIMIVIGTTPTIATAIGAFVGAIINYFLQHKITFRSKLNHLSLSLRYIFASTLIWLANFVVFFMLFQTAIFTTVAAQGVTTLTVAIMSYFLYKRIVFNEY